VGLDRLELREHQISDHPLISVRLVVEPDRRDRAARR
jgi:hypothetical protein